ncbi:membrane protein RL11Q [Cercopithecine betaherpesvirus 5]|uniref:Membrane protein RL11Q n=1 Tax=Simian cytomegalovirus (strain Colburn) TaxID=50292 RepID=G8XT83_SCMVC|nr:membrane protein RL11Q [Cercopithecine betaherpesvirus 5]AEV80376.1 membrane protein RL11Q [Cercopithecine betaherpesvirus 5]
MRIWYFILITATIHTHLALRCTHTESVTVNVGDDVTLGNSRYLRVTWHQPPCKSNQDILCRVTPDGEEMFLSNKSVMFRCKDKSTKLGLKKLTSGDSGQYCKDVNNTKRGKTETIRTCYNVTVQTQTMSTSPKTQTSKLTTPVDKTHLTKFPTALRHTGYGVPHLNVHQYNHIASIMELAIFLLFLAIVILFCLKIPGRFWLNIY